MRTFLIVIVCFLFQSVFSQFILKGTVKDEQKKPIPGVRISVLNTTYGVPTNHNGDYYIEFKTGGEKIIQYNMIGFEPFLDTIQFGTNVIVHDVVLSEKSKALNTVEIYADKRDIAKEVMEKVIKNKKNLARQYNSYPM